MSEGPDIARLAALIGDPARANMLRALALEGNSDPAVKAALMAGGALAGLVGYGVYRGLKRFVSPHH